MKNRKRTFILIFSVFLLTACKSSKSIQREMSGIQSELFYELTTPVYRDNINHTVYLNPIDYSAMLPYTTVKRTGGKVIPLLFYNLEQDKYGVALGEASLQQPYRFFLTDALSAQCNRSSCFNLRMNNDIVLPDSALILEVKINKNETTTKMVYKIFGIYIPVNEWLDFRSERWEIYGPVGWLDVSVRLLQQGNCLLEKTYSVTTDLPYTVKKIENPSLAYESCVEDMAECLSYATKEIAENISRDLHLLLLNKQNR